MKYCEDISNQIKIIRIKKNMSQKRFGEKIGLSGKAISCYETGRAIPPLDILEKIASTYNTQVILVGKRQKLILREKISHLKNQLEELSQMLSEQY